ncbi:nuclear transport factor 2 family protein [Thalassobaculum sp. OXR-137]|uniref:nuclear transport factor 2 family protein n=1 Tax=Thalassobaculum sp. OXR-137 TaxID=3100173 RepID=UPI002AC9B88F|nr:nuclear transport factor 2 family protein [Thalassobaculum sp. OXR-137]WPZ35024.1 nuclear transport factor 2 family protein [Thalassobaculum sp. OXR-137]
MKPAAPIALYFDAAKETGGDAPLDAFSPDATVRDEGKTHVGHAAIEAWWRAAHEAYGHTAEPCEIRDEDGRTVVRARVEGQFPGSPALLTFTFGLRDARISTLEIGA